MVRDKHVKYILFVNCIYNVSVVHNSNTDPKINGISTPDGLTW